MITRCLFITLFLLMMAVTSEADYRQLMKDFDAYQEPDYTDPQEPVAPDVKQLPEEGTRFMLEKKQIRQAASAWTKTLGTPHAEKGFFCPPPGVLESLRPAATDATVATDALAKRFSLETLEILCLLRNPGIRAAEDRARGAIDTFSQVLALDEILRRYSAFTEGMMPGIGPMKGKEPVEKRFPFPGVLSLKGEIVGQAVKAAMQDLEIARREAITEARKAYWDLLFVRKARRITRDTLDLLRRLEKVAIARYETGGTSYQDVIKVRIQREILEEDIDSLLEKQRNVETKIREILNLPPETNIGPPENGEPVRVVPPLRALYKLALERRQELRRMRAQVGKMERLIEMAETMILPPYTLGFSFYEDEAVNQVGSIATKEAFPVSTQASTGFGLPKMPWYGIEDAYLRQTHQELNALRRELEKEEAATMMLVRNAWFRLDLAKREESLYRNSILKLSRTALDVSTQGYEAGNVSFADVISSYTSWLDTNLAAEQKMSALGIARAQLENVLGAPLPQERKEAPQ
jgi:cobalt-zinc-cadmium efflux system outer membrane protein